MSQYYRNYRTSGKKQFFRCRRRGKIAGVCAGVADHFGWDLTVLRLLAILGLIFFTLPTVVAYVITTVLTDKT
jgi:phage shock protein C